MSMEIHLSAWRRRLTGIVIVGCMMPLTFSQTSAYDLIGIRCVGYEEPLPTIADEVECFYAPKDAKFDVYIRPSRGIGWWRGAVVRIDEEYPATLTTDTATYRFEGSLISRGDRWTEWLVL